MSYIIRTGVRPKRDRDFGKRYNKKSGGNSSFSKRSDGANRSERSEGSSEGGYKKRAYAGGGSSYGTRPRTDSSTGTGSRFDSKPGAKRFSGKRIDTRPGSDRSEGDRPRFGKPRFAGKPRFNSERSGGFRGGAGRSGGRPTGGNRRGRSQGENIDINKYVARAEIVVDEEQVEIKHKFADFAFDAKLKEAIEQKGFTSPTPIQDQAIPFILKGRDVVGLANTGTGKTAAFLLPLITKARLIPNEKVLVLAPTRELAIQIADELKMFTSNAYMNFTCCVGGMHIGKQIDSLRRNNNFVIGTPGRVKDLIQRKMINTAQFNTIVLDEADRMLDMGFIDDMRWILSGFPKERQTLFFSATLSREIEKLIHDFLKEPEMVSVRKRETSKNVDQDVVKISKSENKLEVLCKMLKSHEFEKVMIFGRTKRGVEVLSKNLHKQGFKADSIHGDKSHNQRQRSLKAFKEGRINILVATDVAARGLDIPNVTHVINFDQPQTYDDYVHRIGRTGRGEAKGKAFTFVDQH